MKQNKAIATPITTSLGYAWRWERSRSLLIFLFILVNEALNFINEALNSINEPFNSINEPLNSINEPLNSINESVFAEFSLLACQALNVGIDFIVGWVSSPVRAGKMPTPQEFINALF
ncbi:MAG: hypothetical protein RMY62_003185 [Nostoc sp. ZfuVER08]|nr:hypothetical protein [Nostoc sp. ZfuVER08]